MEAILDKGYRLSGPVVNLAAAGVANAVAVYQQSNYALQTGTKSFIPRKIRIMNNAAGGTTIILGTGVGGAFVARYPAFNTLNNLEGEWQELNLPAQEFFADLTAYPVALAGGGTIDIQVEVEEIG